MDPADPVLGVYAVKPKAKRTSRHKGEEARRLTDAEVAKHETLLAGIRSGAVDLDSLKVEPPRGLRCKVVR
jgi:hypothetical protein